MQSLNMCGVRTGVHSSSLLYGGACGTTGVSRMASGKVPQPGLLALFGLLPVMPVAAKSRGRGPGNMWQCMLGSVHDLHTVYPEKNQRVP